MKRKSETVTHRIGCAGWNVPKKYRCSNLTYLECYAQFFNCVEINSSFYRHHQAKTYAKWASLVPDDFLFAVKIPKSISHEREDIKTTFRRFALEVGELGSKLGPLLLQFPPKYGFDFNEAADLFSFLRSNFDGEIVCEPRHVTWFESDALDSLVNHRISLVIADPKPTANSPGLSCSWPSDYFRLHGSPRKYHSSYDKKFLNDFRESNFSTKDSKWVIFDNTTQGHAFENALSLQKMIKFI